MGNDSSCVLRVDNGEKSILLTGDIEKSAENDLLASAPQQLPTTILVAPHHGSKTSGLNEFIKAIHPSIILYATGYRNRYHFPHESIVMAYAGMNTRQFNTAETGAIRFNLEKGKTTLLPEIYRATNKRYWYHQ